MRTLAVHTGALGDFLLACPALARLAEAGPLSVAGAPSRVAIAVAAGIADRAIPLDSLCLHEVLTSDPRAPLSARFRDAVQGFDRAVVWMRDPGGVLAQAFRAAVVAEVVCAPGLPGAAWPGRAADYYLNSINAPPVGAFTLQLSPLPGLDVLIAPGSGSPRKNWPVACFQAVADYFVAQGRRVSCLIGPAEEGLGPLRGTHALVVPDLVPLARQLAGAKLFIGNDTGPMHLAALCGCPTIAIFGPTSTDTWHPLGEQSVVVSAPGAWPTVDEVITAACCRIGAG